MRNAYPNGLVAPNLRHLFEWKFKILSSSS